MIDARLAVAAAAAWLGVAATMAALSGVQPVSAQGPAAAIVLRAAAALLIASGATLVIALRWGRSGRWMALGLSGLLVAVGAAVGAHQVVADSGWPVGGWVTARATATIDGLVTGEPQQRRPSAVQSWRADWLDVRLATSRISARGQHVDVGVPVVVRVPLDAVVPPPGSRVRLVGRLSSALYAGAVAVVTVSASPAFVVVHAPGPVDAAAHAMRLALRSAVSQVQPDAGALVAGLATGDDALQSRQLAADMRASGLSHLTAVSGGNVAVILAVVLGLAAAVRLSLRWRVTIGLLALGFFVVLVGPQPSVLRAAVMGSVLVLALLAGGRRSGPSVLATAVVVLVLVSPPLAVSWGFSLSVFATGGLILLAPLIDGRLARAPWARWCPPAIRRAVALTLSAQVATLPLLVAMGSAVGWVSLPANLVAMPAVPPVTILGLAAAATGPLSASVAGVFAHVAAVPAGWIAWVAHTSVRLPLARLPWPAGAAGALASIVAISSAVLVAIALHKRFPNGVPRRARIVVATVLGPVLLLWLLCPPGRREWPPPGWFVIMCDVGQGDALLLHDGDDSAVLVDAGPDPDAIDRCVNDAQVTTISTVVLTHFHADHVGGLAGVLRGREVGPVLVNPVREPAEEALAVDELLASTGHPAAEAIAAGDRRQVGDVDWVALWPRRRIDAGSVPNNASIVLAAHVTGRGVLLTGDIEPEAQAAIGYALRDYHFEVVKVPHHGSRYQDRRFPQWAPASVALISVGLGNDYGHPAAETIAAWQAIGATVVRTDRDGDVAVVAIPGSTSVGLARH